MAECVKLKRKRAHKYFHDKLLRTTLQFYCPICPFLVLRIKKKIIIIYAPNQIQVYFLKIIYIYI